MGYLGINVTGGGGGGGGLMEPNILHPKKYKTGNFKTFTCRLFESCFPILRELRIGLRKHY